jgi:DNA phosphorothioation-associated putative methyltransferase
MDPIAIPRHKTAIRRGDFSRPIKCALRDGLIDQSVSVFDYGCGRGEDMELLRQQGVMCSGWDPTYCPDGAKQPADVVNLGYVINVVEDPDERARTLAEAWNLCRGVFVVSAQVLVSGRGRNPVEYGDGVLTNRGTFQKFFDQGELKAYLEEHLLAEAIPAGIGVYYVFRDESRLQQHLAGGYQRRMVPPRPRRAVEDAEQHRALLDPFMQAILSLGRLPEADEFAGAGELIVRFGSVKRAFSVVQKLMGSQTWEEAGRRRREDLLVYLALGRFRRRPPFGMLPLTLQRDMRVFFGSYGKACDEADALLFRAGDTVAVDAACRNSAVGKLLPDALYVHRSALDDLGPLLRVYEGCGRAYLGEIEGANLIKLHRHSGKVSYLIYPDFETDPHPALLRSVKLSLRTRELDSYDYSGSKNPPILHRKESFLHPDHPLYTRFARLSQQEERRGLLADASSIGTLDGWNRRLHDAGFLIRGHRLIKLKCADIHSEGGGAGQEAGLADPETITQDRGC